METYVGNSSFSALYEGQGLPFRIYQDNNYADLYIATAIPGQYTVSIYGDKLTRISGKFVKGMGWSEKAYQDIEWDGNTDGLVAAVGGPYYKVMDWTLAEDLDGVTIHYIEGENAEDGSFEDSFEEGTYEWTDGLYSVGDDFVWFAEKPVEFDGVEFPEAGLYFKKVVSEEDPWSSARVMKLVAPDKIHYIDEKYIYKSEYSERLNINWGLDANGNSGYIDTYDLKHLGNIIGARLPLHFTFYDNNGNVAHVQFDNLIDTRFNEVTTDTGRKFTVSAHAPISKTRNIWITLYIDWKTDNSIIANSCTFEYGYSDDSPDHLYISSIYSTPF